MNLENIESFGICRKEDILSKMTIIKTKEFILRPMRMSDAETYLKIRNDPDSKRGFMSSVNTLAEAKKILRDYISEYKKKKPSKEVLAIEVDGEFAGWVDVHDMNQKYLEHIARIGYCLHPKFRGRGIMTRAVKLVINYTFKKYNLKRLEGICRTFNKTSSHVLEKTGFKLEGIMRKNKFKDGKYLDDMVWAIVR